MCHSGPLSYFQISPFLQERIQSLINPSLSSRISTIFCLPSTFTHNFYPQYFHRFPQIFSDLHRFILPFSLYFLAIFYLAPSLQDLHPSSTDLLKIFQKLSFLHPFLLGTWTVGHSGPLSSFPQIFTDLHRFILPFTLYLSIIYPLLCLQDLHRSSTDLS